MLAITYSMKNKMKAAKWGTPKKKTKKKMNDERLLNKLKNCHEWMMKDHWMKIEGHLSEFSMRNELWVTNQSLRKKYGHWFKNIWCNGGGSLWLST